MLPLKAEDSATNDSFRVMGCGEMHLSILIETMRREGYELQVSPARSDPRGGRQGHGAYGACRHRRARGLPGQCYDRPGARKAILDEHADDEQPLLGIEFRMPSRGLFGYRSQFRPTPTVKAS